LKGDDGSGCRGASPVIDFGFQRFSLERLAEYKKTAAELGFKAISTNDHLIYSRPWLDAPTALTAVLSQSGSMAVGMSVTPANRTWPGAIG